MRKPERSTYTALDFLQWREAGGLVISPKFQRRGVWTRAARSYLIDTLLLELPVPPIYLRVTQDPKKKGMIREVIDGQQRVSAVLEFMDDKYALAKNIESNCVGKTYSELSEIQQNKISQYSFICEVFYGVDDADILRVFARLNTYSVKLNLQELRNGRYFGQFKQTVYSLSVEHLEFWRNSKLFGEQSIARMQEVELTSELVILAMAGLQDKKKSIDSFYERNDDAFPDSLKLADRFRRTIDSIAEALDDSLPVSEFRRVPLFYSLYGAVYHRIYGVPGTDRPTPASGRLSSADAESLRDATDLLSEVVHSAKQEGVASPAYERFVNACLRQTDNIHPRTLRLETIYDTAYG
ncbi:MAG: DUF262 domain-containing protein [Bauldia sp.]|nr:DUF262 domain-containing protein [Bauldia sp.]MCW5717794.1 DUF262 domain-containing protein [Bauldia sp.]